ncbi:MAG: hypothetical protein AB7D47_01515 [Desulfovibrio sp.]|jgi:recombinational DNA repair protein (RecF pathway)
MRNQCCKCKQRIDYWDFYMQSEEGKICSACLVEQSAPESEIRQLFRQAPSRRAGLAALREMRIRDLESEPLVLAGHHG